MKDVQSVVVGVDGSQGAKAALIEAVRIGQRNDARLHIVQVVTADIVEHFRETWIVPTDEILGRIRDGLKNFVHECAGTILSAEMHVVIGHPFIELVGMAEDTKADLLVLGSQGWNASSHRTGVIAMKCVRKAKAPVLLVKKEQDKAFEKVVACVDFSAISSTIVEQAAEIARQDGASLDIVHVYFPPWLYPTNVQYDLKPTPGDDYHRQYEATVNDHLHAFVAPFEERYRDLHLTSHLLEHSHAAYGITTYLRDHEIDLAVMGTHGRTGIGRLVIGTTAERVVQEAPCSTLTFRPGPA